MKKWRKYSSSEESESSSFDNNIGINNMNEEEEEERIKYNKENNLNQDFSKKKKYKTVKNTKVEILLKPVKNNEEKLISEISKNEMKNKVNLLKNEKLEKNLSEKYGKGFKLLKMSGYKIGSGLGKLEQGITDPIEIQMKKGKSGIKKGEEYFNPIENDKNNNFILGKKRHLDNQYIKDIEEDFKNFEDIIFLFKKNPFDDVLFKKLIQSNNHNNSFNKNKYNKFYKKKEEKISFDKIFNLDLEKRKEVISNLINLTRDKIKDNLIHFYSINNHKQIYEKMNENSFNETEKLELISSNKLNFLNTLNDKKMVYPNDNNLKSIRNYIKLYIDLLKNNEILYKYSYNTLTQYCIKNVIKSFNENKFNIYQYLSEDISNQINLFCRDVENLLRLTYDSNNNDNEENFNVLGKYNEEKISFPIEKSEKYYSMFLYKILLFNFIQLIKLQWNVKEYYPLVSFFTLYKDIIPKYFINYLSEIISNKILDFLNSNYKFKPQNSAQLNIHFWIHPLLDIISFESINKIIFFIQNNIEKDIIEWNIEDDNQLYNLIKLLNPWKKIFESKFWFNINEKYIFPKLKFILKNSHLNIENPKLKYINPIFILYEENYISSEKTIEMLKKYFFPKFLKKIDNFLYIKTTKERIETVKKYYEFYKETIPKQIIQNDEIQKLLKDSLILIYKYSKKIK